MSTFKINQAVLSNVFIVPAALKEIFKTASHNQLKIALHIFSDISADIDEQKIADELLLPLYEVEDALGFLSSQGLLSCETSTATEKAAAPKKARVGSYRPTREEIAQIGTNDENLQYLLREAQVKFGRPLKQNEMSTLTWLYVDEGMELPIIITLLEYAVKQEKVNVRFIESTAVKWLNAGVETLSDVDDFLNEETKAELAWKLASACFGLSGRKPSSKEKELAALWVNDYGYGKELLIKAYDVCVDSTGGYNAAYIKKVIEGWHKQGVKSIDDIDKIAKPATKQNKKGDYAAYDVDLLKKLLDEE